MSKDGKIKCNSISEELITTYNLAVAKVYNQNSSYHFSIRKEKCIIENRIVNQHNTYESDFKNNESIHKTKEKFSVEIIKLEETDIDKKTAPITGVSFLVYNGCKLTFNILYNNSFMFKNMIKISSISLNEDIEFPHGVLYREINRLHSKEVKDELAKSILELHLRGVKYTKIEATQ